MEFGELKPLLATLLLPPGGPLLLALLGLLLMLRQRRAFGAVLGLLGLGSLWLLACNGVAVALAQNILPPALPLPPAQLAGGNVQAIVVLGGGVHARAPEYGQAQPSANTLARLRYGAWLARQSGKPVAFAGGKGWGTDADTTSEGEVAKRTARQDWGLELRWVDDRSRDTEENARLMWNLMRADQVRRIALVTDAWHMPRAQWQFERAGFQVVAAPIGFVVPRQKPLLEWLPSGYGLVASRAVLREWVALKVAGH
jgi:uncharacterized SAM-binding protein YcdF (DUF218 family)